MGEDLTDDLTKTLAHERAQQRLRDADGSVFQAFDALDLGFDHEDAARYMEYPLRFLSDDAEYSRVVGVVLAFAMTAIEMERELPKPEDNRS